MEKIEQVFEPLSPIAGYCSSSSLTLSVIGVVESEIHLRDFPVVSFLKDKFIHMNPRFSSIIVEGADGEKSWKRVEVKVEDHIYVPTFPFGLSSESYDEYFNEYLTDVYEKQFVQNRPLWEIHVVKYPTTKAAGNIVFKLHHALGDGYTLMGCLLTCLKRADDPSLPLSFPSRQRSKRGGENKGNFLSFLLNTFCDFFWTSLVEDDVSPIRSGYDGSGFRQVEISTMDFSIDLIKRVKTKLGVSVNDVLTGILFWGIRLYMQDADQESIKSRSTALILLNTRKAGVAYKSAEDMAKSKTDSPWGNQFAFMNVPIHKVTGFQVINPIEFISEAEKAIKKKRNSAAVFLGQKLVEMVKKFRGSEEGGRCFQKILHNSSLMISNMIGPVEKMRMGNHPIKGLYFMVGGSPQSVTICVVSYLGSLRIAIGTERGFIDQKKLKSCFQTAFDDVLKASFTVVTVGNNVPNKQIL